ncbi:hypothetical protein ACHAQJ_001524 [Trichoderma viride]
MKSSVHIKEVAKPSKPPNTSVSKSNPPTTNAPPVAQLQFGDVIYTQLALQQQDAVFNKLSASSHSMEALVKEGYLLNAEEEPTTKRKKPIPGLADFRQSPPRHSAMTKRHAVVIDCEMAENLEGLDELISLCAIDFLTGKTLIHSIVVPSQRITNWRTEIHGIDATAILEAIKHQKALHGWAAARRELWKHIDDDTILIGQTICFDFEALHIFHTRVVDSAMLATEAVFNDKRKKKQPRRRWGLQELCDTFLGIQIRNGSGIHSNLEDVLAAREVVLQYLLKPEEFKNWATKTRKEFWKPKEGSKKSKKKESKKNPKKATPRSAGQPIQTSEEHEGFYDSLDDDDDISYDYSDDDGIIQYERDWLIKFDADVAYVDYVD